jgi:uncharacterized protein (TIGR00290 family)
MSIDLIAEPARGYGGYQSAFARMIDALERHRLAGLICGDVLRWSSWAQVRDVCAERRVEIAQPLLCMSPRDLLTQCTDPPFEATIIAARKDRFPQSVLGMSLDAAIMEQLLALGDVVACGEDGEYHTLVLNGPSFRQGLEITDSEHTMNDTHWLLRIDGVRVAGSEMTA